MADRAPGISEAHQKRKLLKRSGVKPKVLSEVLQSLEKKQTHPAPTAQPKGPIMKAKCKRLAGRTIVVGTTPFKFDDDGICAAESKGRGSFATDFKSLVRMNGIEDITHVAEVAPVVIEEREEVPPVVVAPPVLKEEPVVEEVKSPPEEEEIEKTTKSYKRKRSFKSSEGDK